jgi:S-DNA-T family DNA segregation ATPase FtsK/SpoIIIE
MRIDLSVVGSDGRTRDVAVEAPGDTPLGEIAAALGVEPRALVPAGGSPHTDLAASGLRSGAVVPISNASSGGSALWLTVANGSDAGHTLPLRAGRMILGRGSDCDLVLRGAGVSRRHAEVLVGADAVAVRDLGSTHGTVVDGRPVGAAPVAVGPDRPVRIGDVELVVRRGQQRTIARRRAADGRVLVCRGPRESPPEPPTEVVLPAAARPPARAAGFLTAVVPALGGIALAAALASPLLLAASALSPAALIAQDGVGRLRGRRARRRARRGAADAACLAEAELAKARVAERAALRHLAPDPAELATIAAGPGPRLWERRAGDEDLLSVRVGLAHVRSRVQVRRGDLAQPAADLGDLPRRIDLRAGPCAVVGPAPAARALARWIVLQLAVLAAPADVHVWLLCARSLQHEWRWARWLPHLHTVAATGPQHRDAAERLAADGSPAVVVGEGISARVGGRLQQLAAEGRIGLLMLGERRDQLPGGCAAIVDVGAGSLLTDGDSVPVRADGIGPALAEAVARDLAPLALDGENTVLVPSRCSLREVLDLPRLDPGALSARRRAGLGRPRVPLGSDGRRPVVLDLQVDGPHVLVAGTTGSGKSELLRTLVLGLAVNVSPEELHLLLFDFKGGATFAALAGLPHTLGVLTDLDRAGAVRALRSLNAELLRRERLLAAAGAPDLDRFRASGGRTLARLVVVIDEFAALTAADERLLPGLVSLAQRGRSLGLHLVLATQRPAACVSADVRANTSARIALRTVSAADSVDVIDVPDAAALDPRCPGRALLLTTGRPVLFQTAGGGIAADRAEASRPPVTPLDEWRRPVRDLEAAPDPEAGIAELIDALRAAAPPAFDRPALWLPPLPPVLPAAALAADPDPHRVPWGLLDLPAEQRQDVLVLDLRAGGGVLVTGGPGSGRTTALAALAVGAAARLGSGLHLHVIDPGRRLAPLSDLPGAGTVAVGAAAVETAAALIEALRSEVDRRMGAADPGDTDAPPVLVLVDGWEALCAAAEEFDGGRCVDQLLDLMRCCGSAGVTVVLAGDRGTLAGRVTGAATRRFLLRLADRADYATAGVPTDAVPTDPPPGRAVRIPDAAELQFAVVGSDAGRWTDAVAALAVGPAAGEPADRAPIRLRALPAAVRVAELPAPPPAGRISVVLGLGGDAATPVVIDLAEGHRTLLVAGPARSGRSGTLAGVLTQLVGRPGIRPAVNCSPRSPLRGYAVEHGVAVHDPRTVAGRDEEASVLLVDDCEQAAGGPLEDWLLERLAAAEWSGALVAAVRSDQLAVAYRGLLAQLRSLGSALLLQPTSSDADLFGISVPRGRRHTVAGRGLLLADPGWGLSEPVVRLQAALP